jgi:hypothetical protein
MRTAMAISASVGLTVALTSAAFAQGGMPSQRTPGGIESRTLPADLPEAHLIRGEVTQIDPATGIVAVRTDKGTLDLWFRPTAVKDIKPGDRVEVQLGIRKTGAPASTGVDTPLQPAIEQSRPRSQPPGGPTPGLPDSPKSP